VNLDGEMALHSKDGKTFKVSKRAAMMSQLVKTAVETDKDAKEVTLYHIESPIVEKVIQYMNYHVNHPPRKLEKPLKSGNLRELVDEFRCKIYGCGSGNHVQIVAGCQLHGREKLTAPDVCKSGFFNERQNTRSDTQDV